MRQKLASFIWAAEGLILGVWLCPREGQVNPFSVETLKLLPQAWWEALKGRRAVFHGKGILMP